MASAAAVNAFETEPIWKMVSPSTGLAILQAAHAEALGQADLAVLDDGDGDARVALALAQGLDLGLEAGRRRGPGKGGHGERDGERGEDIDACGASLGCGLAARALRPFHSRQTPQVISGRT